MTAVDIIIVNWNSGDWLRRCVDSIREHGKTLLGRVIVVDNGSVDGSDRVETDTLPLEIVRTGENLGFGKACNLGVGRGHAPYVLFLNPDAALLPDTLENAVSFMERPENAGIGVCGAKLLDENGEVHRHCANLPTVGMFLAAATGLAAVFPARFPTLHQYGFDHLSSRLVDHVIGAFYLIRRDLLERLGGFDERFFVYLEDLDLSARVLQAGFQVYYLNEAVGFHQGGGTSEQVKPHRLAYSLESRIVYAFKHFSWPAALLTTGATLIVEPFPRLLRAMVHRSWQETKDTVSGFGILWWRLGARILHKSVQGRATA